MMKRYWQWLWWFVIGLVGVWQPVGGNAFTGDIKSDPSLLVQKYLSLDKKGARLSADSHDVLAPYIDWEEEPSWGQVVVIAKFDVIEDVSQWEVLTATEALIPVTFEVLGTMYWETATFLSDPQISLEFFHVKAIDERWRIVAPQLPPHVGKKRLIDFIRLSQLQETGEPQKLTLQNLQKQLTQTP